MSNEEVRPPFAVLASFSLLLLVVLLSLSRVDPTDIWHLATAREFFTSGRWPITNTFSYSYTDYPLYQQYILYQTVVYSVWSTFGFPGLSVLTSLAFLLCIWLLSKLAKTRLYHWSLLWLLVVFGLQQRMVLRPYIASFPLLLVILILLFHYREHSSRRARAATCAGIVLVQYLWILSHQIYILGIVLQLGLLSAIIVARILPDFLRVRFYAGDAKLPLTPIVCSLVCSIILISAGPLGLDAYIGVMKTFQGLDYLRGHVRELRSIWEVPYALMLVVAASAVYCYAAIRVRRGIDLFELGVLAVFLAMAVVAWRGVAFYVPIAGALSIRRLSQTGIFSASRMWYLLRTGFLAGIVVFTFAIRWISAPTPWYGQQAGIGKAEGPWPDSMLEYLTVNTPQGPGMNLSWYLGNPLILSLYPKKQVLVDPRTETYPREFIERIFRAEESESELRSILDQFSVTWILLETRNHSLWKRAKELIATGYWHVAKVDPNCILLLPNSDDESAQKDMGLVFSEVQYSINAAVREQQEKTVRELHQCLKGVGTCL